MSGLPVMPEKASEPPHCSASRRDDTAYFFLPSQFLQHVSFRFDFQEWRWCVGWGRNLGRAGLGVAGVEASVGLCDILEDVRQSAMAHETGFGWGY